MTISPIGTSWREFKEKNMSPQERTNLDLKASILCAMIEARHEKGISQKQLEHLSGVSQPVIARLETDVSDPQLTTILKILQPLGKTLAVVDLK
jgi:DNA-binding XRE family transcriptional regulator